MLLMPFALLRCHIWQKPPLAVCKRLLSIKNIDTIISCNIFGINKLTFLVGGRDCVHSSPIITVIDSSLLETASLFWLTRGRSWEDWNVIYLEKCANLFHFFINDFFSQYWFDMPFLHNMKVCLKRVEDNLHLSKKEHNQK